MGAMVSKGSPSRRRILIVDDEPELVRALTLRFSSAGYETLSASDGLVAVELALGQQPDLVLLDIGLPLEDGYQVATRLRLAHRTAHIPIVFLTARTWDLDKARQVRPEGYVVKPYQPAELLDIVGRLIAATSKGNGQRFSNPGRLLVIDEQS
jgi:two-component system, OmpR family, KDP operon response regulator KdpE